ncbi:HD-GYP domain-containing protein [Nitriliruptoraceae bacterium ZYF776]|nr:HD-GYP domain-containing protein [Profundirhabdus halotolerans]
MAATWRLHGYVLAVACAGAVVVGWSVPHVDPLVALGFAGAFLVAEASASALREDVMVSLGNLVVLVALVHGGTALAVVATLGALAVLPWLFADQKLLRTAFNVGQFALSAAVAGLVHQLLVDAGGAGFPDWRAVVALVVAAVVYVVVNNGLVAVVVAIAHGEPLRSTVGTVLRVGWLQVPYAGIAILAAALLRGGQLGPWLLLLLALPVAVARSGLVAYQRVDDAYDRLVRSFVTAIEVKDRYTRGHSERVSTLALHVAEELGMPYDERRLVGYAALLHDVGKIGVPGCVINKPGPLDDEEFTLIAGHPAIGAEILRDIDFLDPVLDVVRYHHERLDGRGYPHGVGADHLGTGVRIVTCVDAFDAMTSTRSYRRALQVDEALAELDRCVGTQFDPTIVAALHAVVARLGWQPTVEFTSEAELDGAEIPRGTATDRHRATLDHLAGSEGTDAGEGGR